jgi:hypothetical protein
MSIAGEMIEIVIKLFCVQLSDVTKYSRPDVSYPYNVTVTRRENEGFGFVIISSVNKAGSTIGKYTSL